MPAPAASRWQRLGEHSVQADFDGTPMVTDTMCDEDVLALGEVLAERDEGFIQITQFTGDLDKDLAFQEKLAEVSGRPILHNILAVNREKPEVHRNRLDWLASANAKGLRIFGQGATVRTGFAFTLEHWNLYDSSPAWNHATTGTFDEKMAKFQNDEVRAAIREETDAAIEKLGRTQALGGPIEQLLVQSVDDCPNADAPSSATSASPCSRSPMQPASIPSTLCWTSPWKAISRSSSWVATAVRTPTTWRR